MEQRTLGTTGLQVSRLGLGAAKQGDFYRAGGEAGAEIVEDYSRDGILRVVEESRSRLRMDVIDLVQFHGSPPVELVDEAFTALLDLKARGRTCPGNDPGRVRHALYSFAC